MTTVADFKRMVQNLLAERFKLTVHREDKKVAEYWLEVAAAGLKIKESTKDRYASQSALMRAGTKAIPRSKLLPGERHVSRNGIKSGDGSNRQISGTAAGMPVEDHTGLTGTYDFYLDYKPNLVAAVATGSASGGRYSGSRT